MTIEAWIALAALVAALIGALITYIIANAKLAQRVERLEQEVGEDTNSGLRGDRHRTNNRLATHKAVLYFLCKKAGVNGDLIQSLEND